MSSRNDLLRKVFVSVFQVLFVIITYFYLSEAFGSISSPFINNPGYSIQFSITMLTFTFFSVLTGPIQGLISGFIAEFFYQFAFLNQIYIGWCIIVSIIGFISGIYKYKPLKYHMGMKVYYTYLIFLICSFITLFLIILNEIVLLRNTTSLDLLLINYGFKYFLLSLLSYIFPVPILLIIYDKFLGEKERDLYYLLLTHHPVSANDHTFYFQFGRTKIYFCTRCSGVVIGGLLSIFITRYIEIAFGQIVTPEIALVLCIVLPIIGLLDWGTQKLKLRNSTTTSRLITGYMIGTALQLLSFTQKYYFQMLIIITLYFTILFILIFIGYKRDMKAFRESLNQMNNQNE